jgi:hypothetical protein
LPFCPFVLKDEPAVEGTDAIVMAKKIVKNLGHDVIAIGRAVDKSFCQ